MRSRRLLACLTAGLLAACASEPTRVTPGQVLLVFDTDAPVPAASDQALALATPLFDRLLIEVFEPGQARPCASCVNEFEVDTRMFQERRVSIGIAPPFGASGYRVRARLFHAAFAGAGGEPEPDSTIEVVASVPIVDSNVIVDANVMLPIERVGDPVGSLDAPVAPEPGTTNASKVGSWPGARRVDCTGQAPAGAACVPGGAYWMGNPRGLSFAPLNYPPRPRLIVLSPFFVASSEVTVRQYRAAGLAPRETWNNSSTGVSSRDWCTFSPAPGPFEALPINCVTWKEARAYCKSVGGDLPSEAQHEYLAGGLVGDAFPWGQDEPQCQDAVFGRGGWGLLETTLAACRPSTPPGSPAEPGSGLRDRLDLPGGSIFDLAGNVSEWMQDTWNRIDEPCWAHPGVYRDPLCSTPSPGDGPLVVYRGGNWAGDAHWMMSYARLSSDPEFANIQTGFRCVWPSR